MKRRFLRTDSRVFTHEPSGVRKERRGSGEREREAQKSFPALSMPSTFPDVRTLYVGEGQHASVTASEVRHPITGRGPHHDSTASTWDDWMCLSLHNCRYCAFFVASAPAAAASNCAHTRSAVYTIHCILAFQRTESKHDLMKSKRSCSCDRRRDGLVVQNPCAATM